jgi:DNA-binding SARP family transcriptional activator
MKAEDVRLAHRTAGYVLEADAEGVDLHRFRSLIAKARTSDGDERVAALLNEAVALWRGAAFAGLTSPWLEGLREALDGQRLSALIDRNEVELRLGRHAGLLGDLHQLIATYPLAERLVCQLMLALYRSGRPAEALTCFEQTRQRLDRELGALPGRALRTMHEQILRDDLVLSACASVGRAEQSLAQGRAEAPAELPHDVRNFVGRTAELAQLHVLLAAHGGDPSNHGAVISAIDGPAGIGKTALAVHWAHQVAHRFSDGQLYVNLRGYDPHDDPLPLGDALAQLLRALGADPTSIPADPREQANLYRSLLAGRRVLVVLDNAACPTMCGRSYLVALLASSS